jgi:phage gp29-like protein
MTNAARVIDLSTARVSLSLAEAAFDKKPPQREFSQAYLDTLSSWSLESVKAALDSHETGDFGSSAMLADAMLRDPQVFSSLSTRVSALSSRAGLPFSLEPSTGVDDRRAESVAKRIDALWWTSCPEAELAAIDRDAIMLGVAVGRVSWSLSASEWVPIVRRFRPHGLYWDEFEKVYMYRTADGETVEVTPGRGGWLLHAPFGGDSWMMGAVRPLGNTWLTRAFARRDRWRYSEKHGLPLLTIKEPFSGADNIEGALGSAAAGVGDFYAQFRNLRPSSVIRLPQSTDKDTPGWEAAYLEPKGTSSAVFKESLDDTRREIVAALLGRDPEMSSSIGGDGVSLLARVEVEKLTTDAEGMATTLREQVWKPYVVFNIDATRPELASWPHWNTRPPVDLSARATTLDKAMDVIAKAVALNIDSAPFLAELQLKALPGGLKEPPPPPAAAPPPKPAPGPTE